MLKIENALSQAPITKAKITHLIFLGRLFVFSAFVKIFCRLAAIDIKWAASSEKSAFEHAQNVRIHILHMRKVSSGHLLSI